MQDNRQRQLARPSTKKVPVWAWLALIAYMVLADNLFSPEYEGWTLAAGWFAAAALCLVNYSSCGRYHCKITGPGFIGLGIMAVLETLGIVSVSAWVTFSALFAVLAVGFGLEYRYKSVCGTCYVIPASSSRANKEDE